MHEFWKSMCSDTVIPFLGSSVQNHFFETLKISFWFNLASTAMVLREMFEGITHSATTVHDSFQDLSYIFFKSPNISLYYKLHNKQ